MVPSHGRSPDPTPDPIGDPTDDPTGDRSPAVPSGGGGHRPGSADVAELHLDRHEPSGPVVGTLLLLHGVTDSAAAWADACSRWTTQGWRVLAADARGHGRSPRWDDAHLARRPGEVLTHDAVALVTAISPRSARPLVVVGHSMGAASAVAAAADVPQLVAGVVAEDPPWPLPPRTRPDPVRARAWAAAQRTEAALGLGDLVARGCAEHPSWPAAELEPWARAKHLTDPRLLATGDIVDPRPWPDLLGAVTAAGVPVLVVTGDDDVRVGRESAAECGRRGAEVVRVTGAGHCVRRDRTEAYHAAVDPWIRALTA